MSFLSDLFEGNFSNLGTDITHAPESAVTDYRSEWVPAAAVAGTLLTAGVLGPELLGGAAAADAAGLGAAEGAAGGTLASEAAAPLAFGSAADAAAPGLAAADTAFGAFDPALFDANLAATEIAPTGVDLGTAAAGADLTATAADPALSASVVDATASPAATGWGDYVPAGWSSATDFSPSYGMTDFFNPGQFSPNDLSNLTGLTPDETSAFITPGGQVDWGGLSSAAQSAEVTPGAAPGAAGGGASWAPSAAETPGITGQTGLSQANSMFGTFQPEQSWFGPGSVTGLSGWQAAGLGLAAAPLALALLRGEPSLPPQATQAQQNANLLSQFGAQQLQAGMSGQLNTGQLAMVNQLGQNELNNYRQTLYNMGVRDPGRDTRYAQMQAQVEQDKAVLTENILQNDIKNGLAALGSASGTLTQVAQMQMTADQQFTNNLVNATTALGRVAGTGMLNPNFAGGGKTTTTTTTYG